MIPTKTPIIEIAPVLVLAVHDGDTLTVSVPLHGLWPEVDTVDATIRVAHCNAAELSAPAGPSARDAVKAWLADPSRGALTALGYGREKYGRWLADVRDSGGALLSSFVLALPGSVPLAIREQMQVNP